MSAFDVGQKYGVSERTVYRILREDPDGVSAAVRAKKAENTASVLEYMHSQTDQVCKIVGLGLAALCDPDKLASASPSQITTALGTLIDKWTMFNNSDKNGTLEEILEAVRGTKDD